MGIITPSHSRLAAVILSAGLVFGGIAAAAPASAATAAPAVPAAASVDAPLTDGGLISPEHPVDPGTNGSIIAPNPADSGTTTQHHTLRAVVLASAVAALAAGVTWVLVVVRRRPAPVRATVRRR
jgi:hypothetical protein